MKKTLHLLYMSLSLRSHLLILALLLSLPAIALIFYTGMERRQEYLMKGTRDVRQLVRTISHEQDYLAIHIESLLSTLSHVSDVKEQNVEATNALLKSIHAQNKQFGNIIVADLAGNVWASALPMTTTFSMKQRRSFINSVKSGRFSSGEYVVGAILNKPTIGFGYPLTTADGVINGVIFCNIDFDVHDILKNHLGSQSEASLSILDYKGLTIHSHNSPENPDGNISGEKAFLKMKAGKANDTFVEAAGNGMEQIVSYRKLQLSGEEFPFMYVRVNIPLEKLLGTARQAQITSTVLLLLLVLTVILLTIPICNYCFVNRIKKIQTASRRLAEGDLTARVSTYLKGGELGELGRTFDDMAEQLAERENLLHQKREELNVLNNDLTRRVEEETERRLKHERILARHDRLAAIGEMIGAIAHQWRQPLATLGATIQSIRMAWELKCLDDTFLECAEADAQRQLEYMSETIEDFRHFFSLDKTLELFNIREKIEELILLVTPQFSNSVVTLKVLDNSGDSPMRVSGYQNEFKQSLLNLVSNSFDSIIEKCSVIKDRDGSDWLDGMIVICLSVTAGNVIVEVIDNGLGIPADYVDKVFEPYFTSKADKGTGIGLYMSRIIIEDSMGGRLSFSSELGNTVFKIEIPRDIPESAVTNV